MLFEILVSIGQKVEKRKRVVLVIALQLLWFMLAIGSWVLLPWAVVKSIGLWGHIVVQGMIPGSVVKLKARSAD